MNKLAVIVFIIGLAIVGGALYFGGVFTLSDDVSRGGRSLDSNGQIRGDDSCAEVVCNYSEPEPEPLDPPAPAPVTPPPAPAVIPTCEGSTYFDQWSGHCVEQNGAGVGACPDGDFDKNLACYCPDGTEQLYGTGGSLGPFMLCGVPVVGAHGY